MDKRNIWVVCDSFDHIDSFTKQLISKAYQLGKESSGKVQVIFIGKASNDELRKCSAYGADEVIYQPCEVKDEKLWLDILSDIYTDSGANIIMFTNTDFSKTLSSFFASRFEVGLTADCIDICFEENNGYVFERAAMSDSMLARIICVDSQCCTCTIKKNAFVEYEIDEVKELVIKERGYAGNRNADVKYEIIKSVKKEVENNTDLDNAKIVFGVGRGVKDKETFDMICQAGKKYNAVIVGTKCVVDDGLVPKKYQVGQSGCSIAPDLYVAFGISGANQHLVGIRNSKQIIAVNNKESAPIFNIADVKIVADVKEFIKEFAK